MPKFDIIDDHFGEPLPVQPTTSMNIEERTFFRATSEERSKQLSQAPRVDRHLDAPDRYVHLSQERTIDEHYSPRTIPSEIPPLPIPSIEITPIAPECVTSVTFDQFSIDAIAFIKNSIDTYPIYGPKPTKTDFNWC